MRRPRPGRGVKSAMSHMVLRVRRRMCTSSPARSSTTSGRRWRCCCSRGLTHSARRARIATAALAFAMWRRPWRVWHCLDTPTRWLSISWAAVLAVMNSVFYLARFCAAWMCDAPFKVVANNRFRSDCTR